MRPVTRPATHGKAEISFGRANRMLHLYQRAPSRLLSPASHDRQTCLVIQANLSGGIVEGDLIDTKIEASEDASVLATAQAAEKAYRCETQLATLNQVYSATGSSWLEVLPKELIVFDGAQVKRQYEVDVQDEAQLLTGDLTVLGRTTMNETVTSGLMQDQWRVRHQGKLVYYDNQELDFTGVHGSHEQSSGLNAPALLNNQHCYASIIYCGPKADRFLPAVRAIEPLDGVRFAASAFDTHGVLRLMATNAKALLETYARLWAALRATLNELPPTIPRIWSV